MNHRNRTPDSDVVFRRQRLRLANSHQLITLSSQLERPSGLRSFCRFKVGPTVDLELGLVQTHCPKSRPMHSAHAVEVRLRLPACLKLLICIQLYALIVEVCLHSVGLLSALCGYVVL